MLTRWLGTGLILTLVLWTTGCHRTTRSYRYCGTVVNAPPADPCCSGAPAPYGQPTVPPTSVYSTPAPYGYYQQ